MRLPFHAAGATSRRTFAAWAVVGLATVTAAAGGCHSAYIDAVVRNRTERPISLVEVDYPSASFGTQTLMPNQDFHYRFKVLGDGETKLLWTDDEHHEHSAPGPKLQEHDEGRLIIVVNPGGPTWQPELTNRKVH